MRMSHTVASRKWNRRGMGDERRNIKYSGLQVSNCHVRRIDRLLVQLQATVNTAAREGGFGAAGDDPTAS